MVISYLMNYSAFDCRYLVSFIIFSSPVLVYSYGIKFKPLKTLIIIFALFSLIFISTSLRSRPFFSTIQVINKTHSVSKVRELILLQKQPYYMVAKKIKLNFKPKSKLLVFISTGDSRFSIKSLDFDGYYTDFQMLENAPKIDFGKYNLLIIKNNEMTSYFINHIKPIKGIDCASYKPAVIPRNKPVFTECEMHKDFLPSKHFVKRFNVIVTNNKKTDSYNIYENLNNPPLRQKPPMP